MRGWGDPPGSALYPGFARTSSGTSPSHLRSSCGVAVVGGVGWGGVCGGGGYNNYGGSWGEGRGGGGSSGHQPAALEQQLWVEGGGGGRCWRVVLCMHIHMHGATVAWPVPACFPTTAQPRSQTNEPRPSVGFAPSSHTASACMPASLKSEPMQLGSVPLRQLFAPKDTRPKKAHPHLLNPRKAHPCRYPAAALT